MAETSFDIHSNVAEVEAWLTSVEQRHVPFAMVLAMTRTAQDVKVDEISVMQRVFDRPTPYTLNALGVKPATKADAIASVEFKGFGGTPAKRFLNPEVHGGERSQKSSERRLAPLMRGYRFWVPGRGAKLNGYGNIAGGTLTSILSQLKMSSDPLQNATGSKRSKAKRKAKAYFVPKGSGLRAGVWQRSGSTIKPVLIFVSRALYRKRFPFYETAAATVARRFDENFAAALSRALSTSNFRGKWT